jgi:hypothetical protein
LQRRSPALPALTARPPCALRAGAVVTGVHLDPRVLGAAGGHALVSASAERLEVDIPSLSRPLRLRLHGAAVHLALLKLPPVSGATAARCSARVDIFFPDAFALRRLPGHPAHRPALPTACIGGGGG